MTARDVNNLLPRLQRWYSTQCNGDWEHQYGVEITTLDNPGWLVKIALTGTSLEDRPFDAVKQPHGDAFQHAKDWMECRVEKGVWQGAGDEAKLARILEEFLAWADRTG